MSNGKTVLITGATSGIGAEYARYYSGQGYDLIITGRRKELIGKLADELSQKNKVSIEVVLSELNNKTDLDSLVSIIKGRQNIEILINNAGFGSITTYHKDTIENQERMLNVHMTAPVVLSHAVISQMIERKSGTIINVASMAAFVSSPQDPLYSATKAFLLNFSQSIYIALKKYGIKVQAVCPGFTWTNFHEKLGIKPEEQVSKGFLSWTNTDKVVQASIKCLKKNKMVCIPGISNNLVVLLLKFIPRWLYYRITEPKD